MRPPSVLGLLLVEGVRDLLFLAEGGLLLASAGDRLRRLPGGVAANLPLLLPLLRLLSLFAALLPLLLSRLSIEVLLPRVLLLDAVGGGRGKKG